MNTAGQAASGPWRALFPHHRSRVFLRLFASYLLVALVPFGVAFFAYRAAIGVTRRSVNDLQVSLLKQGSAAVEQKAVEINSLVNQLLLNPKLREAASITDFGEGSPNTFILYELLQQLKTYYYDRSLITDFVIHFNRSNIVVTSTSAVTRMPLLDYGGFSYDGRGFSDLLDDPARSVYSEYRPARPTVFIGARMEAMLCLHSFPLDDPQRQGLMVLLLNPETLAGYFRSVKEEGASIWIADERGRLLYARGASQEVLDRISALAPALPREGISGFRVRGQEQLATFTTIPAIGWKFVVGTPMSRILGPVVALRRTLILVAGLTALAALALAYAQAYRNSKPVTTLVRLFGGSADPDARPGSRNEYEYLQGSISRLIDGSNSMRQALREQSDIIRRTLFDRLFQGALYDDGQIRALLSHTAVTLEGKRFLVMTVQINEFEAALSAESLGRLDVCRMVIQGAVTDAMAPHIEHVQIPQEKRLSFLLSWTGEEEAMRGWAEGRLRELVAHLASERKIDAIVGLGGIVEDYLSIASSFDQSVQALEYYLNRQSVDPIVWHSTVPTEDVSFSYSPRTEQIVTNLIKAGDAAELESVLDAVHEDNFRRRRLSAILYRHLFFDLRSTLIKVLDQVAVDGREGFLERLSAHGAQDPEAEMQGIREAFLSLCAAVAENKNRRHLDLRRKLEEHVEAHYSSSAYCLGSLVADFGYSEHYLYGIFRELFGRTFAEHLEELRLARACALLRDESVPVKRVAYLVGYNSDTSFRRAFKRNCGVKPTEYRTDNRTRSAPAGAEPQRSA